jgi:hypothetical protein
VFLDDFAVFRTRKAHLQHVELCLEKCRKAGLSLNPAKCAFAVTSGMLLGHIVSKEGIAMDPDKIKAILEAPAPHNAKALSRFLGQIRWHGRMIRHLADFATPLHAAVHRESFSWTEEEEKAFAALKAIAHTCSSGTTPGLEPGVPCIRGCVGHCDRQRVNAEIREKLVPAGLLR